MAFTDGSRSATAGMAHVVWGLVWGWGFQKCAHASAQKRTKINNRAAGAVQGAGLPGHQDW